MRGISVVLSLIVLGSSASAQSIYSGYDASADPQSQANNFAGGANGSGVNSADGAVLNVPRSYRPAMPRQTINFGMKLKYYAASTGSFRNFLEAGFTAGIPNIPSAPSQPKPPAVLTVESGKAYGQQMEDYGNGMEAWRHDSEDELRYRASRLALGFATSETRMLFNNLILPTALHEDPRYVPAYIDGSFGSRMWHAVSAIVVTRTDNGTLTPNISKIGGTLGAAFISEKIYSRLGYTPYTQTKSFTPRIRTGQYVWRYTAFSLAGDLATNVGRELVRTAVRPDIQMYNANGSTTEDNYYPLSVGGKAFYWARSTYAPRNFIQGALIAGVPTIDSMPEFPGVPPINTPAEAIAAEQLLEAYGAAVQGWRDNLENNIRYHERRLIGSFSESETQQLLANFAVPVLSGMDPRYIPLGPGHTAGSRLGNALSGVVIGHMDSGRRMVNLPILMGTVGAAFIAKDAYYPKLDVPQLEGNRVLAKTIGFNFAADALLNVLGEFLGRKSY